MPVTRKLRKSRRAVQMREAQRRRRQRLREQQQSFLQIILPARLRDRLVTLSESTGVTLQEAALEILLGALAPDPVSVEEAFRTELEPTLPDQGGSNARPGREAGEPRTSARHPAATPPVAASDSDRRQMQLF